MNIIENSKSNDYGTTPTEGDESSHSLYLTYWLNERINYLKRDYWIYLSIFFQYFIFFLLVVGFNLLTKLANPKSDLSTSALLLETGVQGAVLLFIVDLAGGYQIRSFHLKKRETKGNWNSLAYFVDIYAVVFIAGLILDFLLIIGLYGNMINYESASDIEISIFIERILYSLVFTFMYIVFQGIVMLEDKKVEKPTQILESELDDFKQKIERIIESDEDKLKRLKKALDAIEKF